jgi:ferric-dicitrate binding protein FerR (iron transport regulator)
MALNGKNIRQVFKKYLLGNASADDANAIDHWYQSFENEMPVSLTEQEREAAKQEIWERIAPAIVPQRKAWVVPMWLKVVSSAAMVTGIILTVFLLTKRARHPELAYKTITTQNGERSVVTIQDGTRLTLNAGTTLHVYNDFSGERRIDLVDGEVFFEVKRDEHRPFRIHSNDLTISVLGTSFDISAYAGLKKISVGVVTGKVSVKRDTTTLDVLTKTRELDYDTEKHSYTTGTVSKSLLAWREGRVVLNDLLFDEMAVLMKKNFGVDIITHDSRIEQTKYTTELPANMTAAEAVEVLAAIHQLGIQKINDHTYLLK